MTQGTVLFSHGFHSGPNAAKIRALGEIATAAGWAVHAVDCEGVMDAGERVGRLCRDAASCRKPLVLVGSSLGGWVSAAASGELAPAALFLIAPAFHMDGLPEPAPAPNAGRLVIVHGWQDDVVPVANAMAYAREHRGALHVYDDGHRLAASIGHIGELLRVLLADAARG